MELTHSAPNRLTFISQLSSKSPTPPKKSATKTCFFLYIILFLIVVTGNLFWGTPWWICWGWWMPMGIWWGFAEGKAPGPPPETRGFMNIFSGISVGKKKKKTCRAEIERDFNFKGKWRKSSYDQIVLVVIDYNMEEKYRYARVFNQCLNHNLIDRCSKRKSGKTKKKWCSKWLTLNFFYRKFRHTQNNFTNCKFNISHWTSVLFP